MPAPASRFLRRDLTRKTAPIFDPSPLFFETLRLLLGLEDGELGGGGEGDVGFELRGVRTRDLGLPKEVDESTTASTLLAVSSSVAAGAVGLVLSPDGLSGVDGLDFGEKRLKLEKMWVKRRERVGEAGEEGREDVVGRGDMTILCPSVAIPRSASFG